LGRRSARLEAGVVVVEGAVLLREAAQAGYRVTDQFVGADGDPIDVDAPVHRLAPGVLERVATTSTPQSVLGVVAWNEAEVHSLDAASFVLVAHEVSDPGNAGTLLRSAEAAGADLVVFTPSSVDVRNPKVVRASAGALFRVPVMTEVTLESLRRSGRTLWGTSSHRGTAHDEADLTGSVALVLGNEAHGLPEDAPVDDWLTIRHRGRAESLNVAMAATVLCFEVSRQRRGATGTVASR
jgi:RNA methyltransferase, TrmH family